MMVVAGRDGIITVIHFIVSVISLVFVISIGSFFAGWEGGGWLGWRVMVVVVVVSLSLSFSLTTGQGQRICCLF